MTEHYIPTRKPYPTLKQTWLLLLIFVGMNVGAGFLILPFQSWAPNFGIFLAYSVGMGATYFIARKLKGENTAGIPHSFQPGKGIIYPVLLVSTWACLLGVTPILELIPMPEQLQELFKDLIDTSSIWAFLSLVVAAPLFEELVFRGIILDGFLQQYSVRKSILWSAFFFGFFHLNPWQFIGAFVLGIFIGWIYHRTRSLLPCMAIHAFANGSTFFLSAILTEEQNEMPLVETIGGIGPLMLTILAAVVVLYLAIRLLDKWLPPAPEMVKDSAPHQEDNILYDERY